jgi:hypothetical protein
MIVLALLLAAAAPPADFLREEENDLLHFRYGWPAAAQAIPALGARLNREMEEERRQATANAQDNRRRARAGGFDYYAEDFDKVWEAAGDNALLLSLTAALGSYSGGAHPNTSYHALLWDRAGDRPVAAASVLGAAALQGFGERYCAALDRQRAERREAPVVRDPQDPFTTCPAIGEQVVAPADSDGNGRFETLRILLGPYLAGPYVEGDYIIDLPFDPADVGRIGEAWRPAFESR